MLLAAWLQQFWSPKTKTPAQESPAEQQADRTSGRHYRILSKRGKTTLGH